jgi:hypothetical protein
METLTKRLCLSILQLIPDIRVMNHLINQLNHFRIHKRFVVPKKLRNINDYIFSVKNSPYSASYGFFIDKEKAKGYVASFLGQEYTIPTLGVFKDLDTLAAFEHPDRYVVKPTHMSQHVLFKNGGKLSEQELQQCKQWLRYSYFLRTRQYNYRFLEPKIIVEPFQSLNGTVPPDFKFFMVDGVCHLIQVDCGRFANRTSDFYDANWNKLNVRLSHANSSQVLKVDDTLIQMKALAEKIGACFEFIRIDLYLTDQGIKFGEFTFTPGLRFEPENLARKIYSKILSAKLSRQAADAPLADNWSRGNERFGLEFPLLN